MVSKEKSVVSGMIDGLRLWGTVCGKKGSCDTCQIAKIRGTNVTCQDFARQFPEKMLSLLLEMNEGELTYYEEYCIRFPECNLSIEDLSECACRKAVFEGDTQCDKEDCVACWNTKYTGDIESK